MSMEIIFKINKMIDSVYFIKMDSYLNNILNIK